ncbi:hypothetical protein EVAR_10553_1 [Eumeta japonica]|uniref:Uncharacterized protein n=1 Tax=Eumeta variegata TaxID=151549 RepID=A0A4C1ZL98_EUMVA|nr:hypothetical protein EVAR_10553_1 [Eumeta japonica]
MDIVKVFYLFAEIYFRDVSVPCVVAKSDRRLRSECTRPGLSKLSMLPASGRCNVRSSTRVDLRPVPRSSRPGRRRNAELRFGESSVIGPLCSSACGFKLLLQRWQSTLSVIRFVIFDSVYSGRGILTSRNSSSRKTVLNGVTSLLGALFHLYFLGNFKVRRFNTISSAHLTATT